MFSKRQKKQLEKMYAKQIFADDALNLEALEGFLFGLAMTPVAILPSVWMPLAFGEAEPVFTSEKEAKNLFEIVFSQYNSLIAQFECEKLVFPFNVGNITPQLLEQIKWWAHGVCTALALEPDIWKMEGEEEIDPTTDIFPVQSVTMLLMMVASMDEMQNNLELEDAYADLDKIVASLPEMIDFLQDYARKYSEDNVDEPDVIPPEPRKKVGRNEPCPCGSGKKYKKCCMDKPQANSVDNVISLADRRVQIAELTPEERMTLSRIVQAQIKISRKDGMIKLQNRDEDFLLRTPHALYELIKMFVSSSEDDDCARMEVCQSLLLVQLTELRFALERGKSDAAQQMRTLNNYLEALMTKDEHGLQVASSVCHFLAEARLPIADRLKTLYLQQGVQSKEDVNALPGKVDDSILLEMLVQHDVEDPYNGYYLLMDTVQMLDNESIVALAVKMLHAEGAECSLLREIAALFVIHPQQQVREQVIAELQSCAADMSSATLSRLILLRNWLPEQERQGLDQCIKHARKARVVCAEIKKCQDIECYASVVDGSGTQMFWLKCGIAKQYRIACFMWKQKEGLVDIWGAETTRTEVNNILRRAKKEVGFAAVERDYVDLMLGHALSVNAARGTVPPMGMLEAVENLGVNSWQPSAIDTQVCLDELIAEAKALKKAIFTTRAQHKIYEESYYWLDKKCFETWFEDHGDIDKMLLKQLGPVDTWAGKKELQGIEIILNDFLENNRQVWAQRQLFATLWLKAYTGRTPLAWHKMLCMTNWIAGDDSLQGNPLMIAIATTSLRAAYERLQ